MVKLFLIFLIISSHTVFAQNITQDLDFIETLDTQGNTFSAPIYFDLDGNLSIISADSNASLSLNPMGYGAYKKSTSNYIQPILKSELSFETQRTNLEWLEIKRMRWEIGLGIGAKLASNVISVGLTPYRGARQVMIRHKKSQDEVTPKPRLPDELEEVKSWSVGDRGSFQRYGGVQIVTSVGFLGASVGAGLTIQNLFSVVVDKISETKVRLSLAEEKLNQRRIKAGAVVADVKWNFFNGKRLTTHFDLDLEDPLHHELYTLALKGKLNVLQSKLPNESQKLEWKGSERVGYFGIPAVAGKYTKRSEYEMDFDDEEEVLDMKSQRTAGWFVPLRNHNKVIYQTDEAITLFWFSEMNKADDEVLTRKFLTPGKMMGAKGFENLLPRNTKLGSALSQLGMSFTRKELEAVSSGMLEEILIHFKTRCENMELKCAKTRSFNKIAKTLRKYRTMKWNDVRDKLGFLMMDQPALIHSYIKAIKSQKKVYFKFLNEKYQSMEGTAPIEI